MSTLKSILKNRKAIISISVIIIICIGVASYFMLNRENKEYSLKDFVKNTELKLELGEELKSEVPDYFDFKNLELSKEEQQTIIKNTIIDLQVKYSDGQDGVKYPSVGEHSIVLKYNNGSDKEDNLKIKVNVVDTTPPTFNDIHEVSFEQGTSDFDFNTVISASDLQEVTIEYILDGLDIQVPNEYIIKAVAKDASENKTEKEIKVIVTKKQSTPASSNVTNPPNNSTTTSPAISNYVGSTGNQELDSLCDKVLNSITSPTASKREQARAIYNWVESNIRYSGSTSGDWVSGAISAFKSRRGNCYAFAYTSKALLTRVGIENTLIHDLDSAHYWNMAKVDGAWYHFDTTTGWGQQRFLWTTQRLKELRYYSPILKQDIWYEWDASAYPTTP